MNRLKDLREEHDLNQTQLANILKVSQASYSRYEQEVKDISINSLKKISDLYNNSIDYILYRTDDRKKYKKNDVIYTDNTNRLKELRINRKKTQRQTAEELNIPLKTYIKYENMSRSLNTLILGIFANFYNTSTDYIVCHTNDSNAHEKSIVNWNTKE